MADAAARRLFDPAAYRCTPGTGTRLRALAATPPRRAHAIRRADENAAVMESLRSMAAGLASAFRLRYASIEAESDGIVQHYGICYRDGVIRIRLRHAVTDRLLKESSLVDTLCHELAHLRHFDHSPRFRRFYEKVLLEARRRGYYRPGPEAAGPRQRPLFGDGDCGTPTAGAPRPRRRTS